MHEPSRRGSVCRRTEVRDIGVESRKILITHSSYGIRFVKRQANEVVHELKMVTSLFSNFYSLLICDSLHSTFDS